MALTACSAGPAQPEPAGDSSMSGSTPEPMLMPDLVGLPALEAGEMVGELDLDSAWGRPVPVRCGVRPGVIARQHPEPGTELSKTTTIRVRTTALDLEVFRGPCEPEDGDLGPLRGPDAALARDFYRFAAEPAPATLFADEVWVALEGGLASTTIDRSALTDLAAWRLDEAYAERVGPFSALDVVAASGGYFELRRGASPGCGGGGLGRPSELAGLRTITLTSPSDTTMSCMDWWGVTLVLGTNDRIRGVVLRLGSP
ncbi:MAG: PASTA domain-containing protein [Nocardioides sp.]|uniref:PASTA domain-containing protein n=1 Tax=Nocardioides sp. TaxID=35761 RepID=UPI0039E4DB65